MWRYGEIENDEEGNPYCTGVLELRDDCGGLLAMIMWFSEEGPYYAHAVDLRDRTLDARIGPCTTLDGAKEECLKKIEGRR